MVCFLNALFLCTLCHQLLFIFIPRLQCNLPKNRYRDVVCYEESRVKLKVIKNKEGSDYIHANYVSGYNRPQAFILTQGECYSLFMLSLTSV